MTLVARRVGPHLVLVAAAALPACKSNADKAPPRATASAASASSAAITATPAPTETSSSRPDGDALVLARVRKIVGEIAGLPSERIPDDTPLSALPNPPDELGVVEIVLAIEEAFKVDISDEEVLRASGATKKGELGKHLTVRKLAALVHRSSK